MQSSFTAQLHPSVASTQEALWFIFQDEYILLQRAAEGAIIPRLVDSAALHFSIAQQHYLGLYGDVPCFVACVHESQATYLPPDLFFQSIREAYTLLNEQEELFYLISRAKQILHWDRSTQFCGRCGKKTEQSSTERAKICTACDSLFFPQISPVMLVLIARNDEILLARSAHFMPGIYSILAGFVEPGETLEQAVVREVKEEVGIAIKNLRYFGSQPWPFVSNLMLGFIAEYDSGTIHVDTTELEDAQWFSIRQLPLLPTSISLSRQMIDAYLDAVVPRL